ncbi:LPD_N [Nesidiocoris tenuis]|uniref:LPD_N n=1 Tax=Nesidiocoris tenuis TaxID=355587 RepID=A0ABN7B9K8_9HEMI|nr:LPD_N [Nesidiocoris tenuis]
MSLPVFGILLLHFSTCWAQDLTLFPDNKEVVYRWSTHATSGTMLPSVLNSSWNLTARVVVQQRPNGTAFFKILQEENNSLSIPFMALYTSGELKEIWVSPEDEPWSINMKRALSSMLQLKLDTVLFKRSSNGVESGLHGECNTEYIVLDGEEKQSLRVKKILDHDSCKKRKIEHWANLPINLCPGKYQDMVISTSEREYLVYPFSNPLIRNVTAFGRVLFQPYQAKAEAHYSKISQLLEFESMNDVTTLISPHPNSTSIELSYSEYPLDPSYGQEPTNSSALAQEIYVLLGDLSDSLSIWEVDVKGLDNQTSFYILDLMSWLKQEDWEQLYKLVTLGTSYRQETIQHLFWDLVPQVGSHAAVLFIKDLITTERLKGFSAGRILANFPFYMKETSEELLTLCEELLKLEEKIGLEVRQSAILSFASQIYTTCKGGRCQADTLDRYAKLYLDKFTGSSAYVDQMLYLQGLSNIELDQVLDFLAPVVTGQVSSDKHIRFLAVWATLPTVYSQQTKIYDIYWPIFSDRSESLEMRAAAMTMLIMSKPNPSRFFTLYWHMQTEPSEQLYNYWYTTIHSLSNTNYPCYEQLGHVASKFVRYVHPRGRIWATGNYILDFEDQDRAYGSLFQVLLFASERTGLPNVFMFMAEHHSLGHTRMYALYLKVEGLDSALCDQLGDMSGWMRSTKQMAKVLNLLQDLKVPLRSPDKLHVELIFKVDGRAVLVQYMNRTNFNRWSNEIRRLSSLYFEFSINYQSLQFPLIIGYKSASDIGAPVLIQIRSASLISTRGSVSQENEGKARNAELDLRYSWNGVTTLKLYDPLQNRWHGADRCRNVHIRLPFATQLVLQMVKSLFKVTAVRHKDFIKGSRLGMVWHASTRLVSNKPIIKSYPNISDEWTMDSEDLGARLGASVFDCNNPDTLPDVLHLLKKSFLANHKNYYMIPGGIIILGVLSLRDQLMFQPQGSNCGVMLYFTPLLTQVEPVILWEDNTMKLSMTRQDGLLWEIIAGSKRLSDGNKEVTFKLYRAPSVSVTVAHIWRVIQLEGAFIVPSKVSGVFHPPTALTGYAFMSWGDATPSQTDKATMVDLKILPGAHNESTSCQGYTPMCLQSASDAAARQTASLQYANLPTWLKMAAHALFPEHIQTESTRTQLTFAYPVALIPWNTKGLCAINHELVLTLDNVTLPFRLGEKETLAVADCSGSTSFAIQLKLEHEIIGANIFGSGDDVQLIPLADKTLEVVVNGSKIENISQGYKRVDIDKTEFNIKLRPPGIVQVELRSGVVLQHYNSTVVILIPAIFRGATCGVCGDFNGDSFNEPSFPYYPSSN